MRNNLDISGHITLEGSKSILNRVLIIASYLKSPLKIINPSSCLDIATMVEDKLRDTFGGETFTSVHVEPLLENSSAK